MGARYRIEIAPDGVDGSSVAFTVDVSASPLRLAEIRVQIGNDGSPLPAELVGLDFHSCMSAAVALSQGVFPSQAEPDTAKPDPVPSSAAERTASEDPTAANPPPKRSLPRTANPPGTGVPSDLAVNYWRLGSAAKVANHYDVPRQVARDWIKELRDQDLIPNPWLPAKDSTSRERPTS